MPTAILQNADAFAFTTLRGVELDLFGASLSWTDEIKTGIVEHQVLKRVGAIHQTAGAPPIRSEFRCVLVGGDVRARYRRIVDAVRQEPEGQLVHPRFGSTRAVCESVGSAETPGENRDTIEFSIRFSETGLRDAPKPAPAALAQSSASKGAEVTAAGKELGGNLEASCSAIGARSAGFLSAMQAADSGLGTVADVDASLQALAANVDAVDSNATATKMLRSAAVLTLAIALQARQRFAAGRPPLIAYRVESVVSLSVLCQNLYGGAALDARAEILRLNRLRRPHAIPAGTVLLVSDPSVVAA